MLTIPPPTDVFFKGRANDKRLGEWVQNGVEPNPEEGTFAILGCPDDTGVRLNHGRPGADKGPDAIRRAFYKMALPAAWQTCRLVDAGNISISTDITQTHLHARSAVEALVKQGLNVILLGGGHDFAAPAFTGFATGLRKKVRLGLINIDPHLDVRELINDKPHSGMPFRQLLTDKVLEGRDLVEFGARPNRNAAPHWEFCEEKGVEVIPFAKTLMPSVPQNFARALSRLSRGPAALGVTLDIDSCSDAEGTSAAPVIGYTARELYAISEIAGQNPKVRYFELAEVAPVLDQNDRSARIAAELIFAFLNARFELCSVRPRTLKKSRNR